MGVYIPKMEMPKNCEECFFLGTDSNAHWYCYCLKKKISITSEKAYDSGCPLIEVPKHGDLIDKGVLKISLLGEEYGTNFPTVFNQIIKVVNSVPVVVESEE